MARNVKPNLTRKAWLGELGRRLVWFFPGNVVEDILLDFQERFDAGHDHCEFESEIILSLGSPAETAALLLEEDPSTKLNCLRYSALWGAALAVCCFFLWLNLSSVSYGLFWISVVVFIPAAAAVLFRLLRGPERTALESKFPAERRASPVFVYGLPAALALVCVAERVAVVWYTGKEAFQDPAGAAWFGNTVFLLGSLLLLALLLAWAVFLCVKGPVGYFPGIVHTFGTLGTAYFTLTYFSVMHGDTFGPVIDLLFSLLPYCVGLGTALAFQSWIDGRKPLPHVFQDDPISWPEWRHWLGVCLLGWFSVEQALEVLEDYRERFELGREQGRPEEVLLSEMGRPETVVRDLLAEDRKARLRRRRTWLWAVAAGLSAWLLVGLLQCFAFGGVGFGWFYYEHAIQISLLTVVLGAGSLFFLLHARKRAAVERRFPASRKPGVWLFLTPPLISILIEGFALWCLYCEFNDQMPVLWGKPLYWFFVISTEFSVLLLSLLLIRTLDRCVSGSIRHLPAVPLLAGSIAHVLCAGIYLRYSNMMYFDLENFVRIMRANLLAVPPCLAGLVCAVVLRLVLRAAGKREG